MKKFDGTLLDYSNYEIFFEDDFRGYNGDVSKMNFRTNPLTGKWYLDPPYDNQNYGWGQELFDPLQVSLLPNGGVRLTAVKTYPPDQIITVTFPDGSTKTRKINYKSGILRAAPLSGLDPNPGQPVGSEFYTGFKYGIFEMRAKMPDNYSGVWPTFWKFGGGVELDTVDTLKAEPAKTIQSGMIAWRSMPNANSAAWTPLPNYTGPTPPIYNANNYYYKGDLVLHDSAVYQAKKLVRRIVFGNLSYKKKGLTLQDRYNTYTVVWTPTEVAFFFNGYKVYSETSEYAPIGSGVTWLVASLQMEEWAPKGSQLNPYTTYMDIDYIRVYKPKNYNPNTTIPEDFNFRFHETTTLFNNLSSLNSVAVSPNGYPLTYHAKAESDLIIRQGGKKLYYKGNESRLHNFYWAALSSGGAEKWIWSTLDQIDNVAGNVVHSPTEERLFYRSKITNNKNGIDSFYFDFNINKWKHENISGSITNVADNIIISPDGKKVYYRDTNKSIYYFQKTNNIWQHFSTIASVKNVEGDLVHSLTQEKIFYRGSDGHLWNLYIYNNVWQILPLDGAYDIDNVAGDLVLSPTEEKIYYRGSDHKMYVFSFEPNPSPGTWKHSCLDLGVNNVQGFVVHDLDRKQLFYIGTDKRMHNFYFENNSWGNNSLNWDIDNVAADKFCVSQGRIFYKGTDNKLHLFYFLRDRWYARSLKDEGNNVQGNIVLSPTNKPFYIGTDGSIMNYYEKWCANYDLAEEEINLD